MCEDCPDEEIELVELRFVGGRNVKGRRGPFRSFNTGETYMMRPGYAELPWWQPVDEEPSKTEERQNFRYSEKEVPPEPSRGLTKAFNMEGPPSEDAFLLGLDKEGLKHFIEGNGGKVDGRWGWARLVEEARKLQ